MCSALLSGWAACSFCILRCSAVRVEAAGSCGSFDILSVVLGRFMSWAALAIVVLIASGLALGGGFKNAHLSVHLMLAIGLAMMLLYLHIRLGPVSEAHARRCNGERLDGRCCESRRRAQNGVINLVLGFITIAIATIGCGRPSLTITDGTACAAPSPASASKSIRGP